MSEGGVRPIRSSGLPTRLRLVELVDRGSFGEVWLARDTSVGLDVAVKFLDRGSAGIDGDRFESEARSLARLSAIPGIVAIRELGLAPDGTPWLATEFLTGGSLRFKLEVDAPAPWSPEAISLARELFTPLATALAAAHRLGVAHGDISPANVLFDDVGAPHLCDFGLAELARGDSLGAANGNSSGSGEAPEHMVLTRPGGLTPAYAAPERLRGADPSQRSDVYSLAATLWHLVTGEPRSERAVESDDELVGVLASAMNPAPGLRPSALELSEAIEKADRPPRWWRYRRSDGKRRHNREP